MKATIIKKLEDLYSEHSKYQELMSENYNTVKDRFGENEIDCEDKDGKKVMIKERLLWDEVWYYGRDSRGGKIMTKKYPEIFEYFDKANEIKKEIDSYEVEKFGFKGSEMRLIDFIKLIGEIVEFKMKKYEE